MMCGVDVFYFFYEGIKLSDVLKKFGKRFVSGVLVVKVSGCFSVFKFCGFEFVVVNC